MTRKLMALALALVVTERVYPQSSGIVAFSNGGLINAPVFDADGTTRLAGSNFRAALYWAPGGASPEQMAQIGPSQPFLTGSLAGFWQGGNRTIPPLPVNGQPVILQVKIWDSLDGALPTFESAEAAGVKIGVSIAILVILNLPPMVTPMTGLQSTTLMPTITLSRGAPGLFTDSSTVGNGTQLTTLCETRVGLNRWFRLTSPYPGEALVTTIGSSIDTVMSAYTGSIVSPTTLTFITCNDDRVTGATASEVRFVVEANKLYLLCVAGKNGATGTINLNHTLLTKLRIRRADSAHVELSWPADASNFIAEASSQFPTDWRSITNRPVVVGGRSVVERDCGDGQEVYRLRLKN